MTWLALDIGGANLKAADGLGWARSVPFTLRCGPEQLAAELSQLLSSAPASARLAVTMTGELCDSFRTKSDGVRQILKAVEAAAAGREIAVYLVDGQMVCVDDAKELPHLAAAGNWHALARFAFRYVGAGCGLLIDVGSTTTDLVPIADGFVVARGTTDTERLLAGELVYSGVCHTPLCAITSSLPWRESQCPVAAEFFSTTADAYVLLGDISEQSAATWTADGRPLTRTYARERLARMICADSTTFTESDALDAAKSIRDTQIVQLSQAIERLTTHATQVINCFVVSGIGEFLARRAIHDASPASRLVSFADEFGNEVSACAPAHALAVLARELEST